MNRSIIYIFLISIIGFVLSCTTADVTPSTDVSAETLAKITAYGTSKGLTFTKDANGLFYVVTTKNPAGRTPVATEFVKLYYTYTKLDGTMLDSTATNQKIPQAYPYLAYNSLLNYMVQYLKEGESGTMVFPSTNQLSEPTVINAKLVSTRNETEQISEYVADKFAGQNIKKTISGLQYLITKTSATGDTVKAGKTVTVNYTGKLLFLNRSRDTNGFFIYTDQFDKGSLSFLVGQGAVVSGFEEATKLLKVGDKGTFIFPSSLGYKADGSFNSSTQLYNIPPYSPLLFEIEVTGVK
jgi:FKBP-type peptidyl-prolyl cis-trans isomerase